MSLTSDAKDWAAASAAVGERMAALGITRVALMRASRLSPVTVRGVLNGAGPRQQGTLYALSTALDWPHGYLAAVAAGRTPPAPDGDAPVLEGIPVSQVQEAQPPPASQAPPLAALLSLADIGHGASLQAESNAMAARLAREISEDVSADERKAVHQFLNEVAREVLSPCFSRSGEP